MQILIKMEQKHGRLCLLLLLKRFVFTFVGFAFNMNNPETLSVLTALNILFTQTPLVQLV